MKHSTDLTDEQWNKIKPLLPAPAHTGRPRADDRSTINGILYFMDKQCRWRDIPARYGSHITCWRRHRNWTRNGTMAQIKVIAHGGEANWEDPKEAIRQAG